MILSFSGDPFLARRAARAALREQGVDPGSLVDLGEGMTAAAVQDAASQGGLFGQAALLLDFGEAFTGQAGVKPRNETMKALAGLKDGALIVVLDPDATPARQKALKELGSHQHLPAPRYERLAPWIAQELKREGVEFEPDVPQLLADLFGEEPAAIASEVRKLASLEGRHDAARVRDLVNRPASHDSFDIVDAIARGDAATGVAVARQLVEEGEAVPRIFGALVWQFLLVAKGVGLIESSGSGRPSAGQAAAALGAKPFVANKALDLARGIDERTLRELLAELLESDVAAKSGGDPELALETAVIRLARRFGKPAAGRAKR